MLRPLCQHRPHNWAHRQKGRNGQAACTVVGVIVTVAVGYLMANDVCSGGRTLYVYTGSNRNLHAACAYRAPYT